MKRESHILRDGVVALHCNHNRNIVCDTRQCCGYRPCKACLRKKHSDDLPTPIHTGHVMRHLQAMRGRIFDLTPDTLNHLTNAFLREPR